MMAYHGKIEISQKKLQDLYDEAMNALVSLGESAHLLREIAEFTVKRIR